MPITFTIKRAAEESGLSKRNLLYLIAQGVLPSVFAGGRRLIPAKALEEFLLCGQRAGRIQASARLPLKRVTLRSDDKSELRKTGRNPSGDELS